MLQQINKIKQDFLDKLTTVSSLEELKDLESDILWKKWQLNEILKGLKDLSNDEKKSVWIEANTLKSLVLNSVADMELELEAKMYENIESEQKIDVTIALDNTEKWHFHPITLTKRLLEEIFVSLWFKVVDGPQVEIEEYNFDKLNIPDNHPARDVWDTFWISKEINDQKAKWEKVLLRTHTSPVQVREMLKWELPLKIIVPGRVFRYEQEDARHTSNFYQLEWLVIGENINFGNLKWTLETVMKKLLWDDTVLRFRPSIFPFTEPSAEIDISCQICHQKDSSCRMCSWTGWVELLWAWMVHPKVLEDCGVDSKKYNGFAFGMWIDRIAAQRFSVASSRMFYQNKFDLNKQF